MKQSIPQTEATDIHYSQNQSRKQPLAFGIWPFTLIPFQPLPAFEQQALFCEGRFPLLSFKYLPSHTSIRGQCQLLKCDPVNLSSCPHSQPVCPHFLCSKCYNLPPVCFCGKLCIAGRLSDYSDSVGAVVQLCKWYVPDRVQSSPQLGMCSIVLPCRGHSNLPHCGRSQFAFMPTFISIVFIYKCVCVSISPVNHL